MWIYHAIMILFFKIASKVGYLKWKLGPGKYLLITCCFELSLQQEISLSCTCKCTSFAWKRDRHLAFYWSPIVGNEQWRTQKIFMGGGWFRVVWWSFVFGVRCLWRHNLTSCPCFQSNVLAKFVDIIMHIFLHALPFFHVSLHRMWIISAPS